jgi:chromate transport protein ChrA
VAMLQRMCVEERKWMTLEAFAELFGLCSSIPGATSSQLCFALGIARLGVLAGLVSYVLFCWVGFVALMLMATFTRALVIPWYLIGLEVGASCAALALVAIAALNLALSLCVTRFTIVVAFASCVVCLALPFWFIYSLVILLSGVGALVYFRFFPPPESPPSPTQMQVIFASWSSFCVLTLSPAVRVSQVGWRGLSRLFRRRVWGAAAHALSLSFHHLPARGGNILSRRIVCGGRWPGCVLDGIKSVPVKAN